ncbi:DNA-binding transcriptional activator HyfR [Fundidesulfovibrio magnetotacticus]|uniref:DNA-binding transcriptional activator HyfR n=1 Tax=Fundidesulfovibrio magnetotacticus TaxID=2730080 RepID=A0A6V8LTL9_9BACT|nr:sigma 54-interacting transcriptional regulator [Fundidesulfovibrio magnetotacticus]GFK93439.1 DNA-binding transcriptional activator HyfR [Fundidesulfovibrio magnetotacticus]
MSDPTVRHAALFSTILDAAHIGLMAVDAMGVVTFINSHAASSLDLADREVTGRHVSEVLPHSQAPHVLATGMPVCGQMLALQGAVLMANHSPLLENGVRTGAISVFQDISILERTSCELHYVRDHIKELSSIINSSYDGMFITDGAGNVLLLNEAYQRMTGISADEVLGKNMRQLVEEQYYDRSVTLLVMETGMPATINQTIKGERTLLVTGNPVFDDAGKLYRVVTNVRDITELISLRDQLEKTREKTRQYESEISYLRSLQIEAGDIVFRSRAMAQALVTATKVAYVDSTVLITGDSGTGKELIAKLIHKKGKGAAQPFITINCAALPDHLLESELFGYEGGAFTGARREGKPGLFELANNGTLFLDEVGDMPMVLQAKLLRAIQEKQIMRLGGTRPVRVNVRIIGATHRDIQKMAERREFRRDLFYRLMVVPIHLPYLRERPEDIPLLAMHFMNKFNKRFGLRKTMLPTAVDTLARYPWPGNVRELENLIERLLVTTADNEITEEHLPAHIRSSAYIPRKGSRMAEAVAEVEAYLLEKAFGKHGNWQRVAQELGIDKATAYRKAAKYGLTKDRPLGARPPLSRN